jgi:hypothetical protein
MKTTSMILNSVVVALIVAVGLAAQDSEPELQPEPVSIDGAWRWDFVMPDGTVTRPRLTLTTSDGALSGTTSFRPGSECAITNVTLQGDRLRYQVFRERNGVLTTTTYTGIWSGKLIHGKIESNWAGPMQSFDWEAIRSHAGVEGVWTWQNSFTSPARANASPGRGGRVGLDIPTRVLLRQENERVTGKAFPRLGRSIPIAHGSITNNDVYFEIERTYRTNSILVKYHGKQTGDAISGSMELEMNGRTRKADWEAKRLD